MQTVWKYTLSSDDEIALMLPKGATPLSVQPQGENVCLWVLVDDDQKMLQQRIFRLAGTGHPIKNKNLKFIGTFQLFGGSFVGHLFEVVANI